jgi:hypothetical protein
VDRTRWHIWMLAMAFKAVQTLLQSPMELFYCVNVQFHEDIVHTCLPPMPTDTYHAGKVTVLHVGAHCTKYI